MTATKQIRVLLAEDHIVVRQGLRALLQADGHFTIVGEAGNGREAVEAARCLNPDVIVMDLAMPVLNGIEATRQILADNSAAKVVILSAHSDEEYLSRAVPLGIAGFIEKYAPVDVLADAIRAVANGKTYFSPSIARRLPQRPSEAPGPSSSFPVGSFSLTPRESEVLQLVAEGSANKQMAAELGISIKTVEKHRQHLMNKLNIHQTAGLTRYAIAVGAVECRVQVTTA